MVSLQSGGVEVTMVFGSCYAQLCISKGVLIVQNGHGQTQIESIRIVRLRFCSKLNFETFF